MKLFTFPDGTIDNNDAVLIVQPFEISFAAIFDDEVTFSSTAGFVLAIAVTFEPSNSFSVTNTFDLAPNNVLELNQNHSSTNTFTLTPNNVIELNNTYNSTNNDVLSPENVIPLSIAFTPFATDDCISATPVSALNLRLSDIIVDYEYFIGVALTLNATSGFVLAIDGTFEPSTPYTETNIYTVNAGNVLDTAIELW